MVTVSWSPGLTTGVLFFIPNDRVGNMDAESQGIGAGCLQAAYQ